MKITAGRFKLDIDSSKNGQPENSYAVLAKVYSVGGVEIASFYLSVDDLHDLKYIAERGITIAER